MEAESVETQPPVPVVAQDPRMQVSALLLDGPPLKKRKLDEERTDMMPTNVDATENRAGVEVNALADAKEKKKKKKATVAALSAPSVTLETYQGPIYEMEFGCYCGQRDPPAMTAATPVVDAAPPSALSADVTLPKVRIYGRLPPPETEIATTLEILRRGDVRCEKCGLFYHVTCLNCPPDSAFPLPGDNGYVFTCRRCSPTNTHDTLQLADRPWMESLRVVLFNLRLSDPSKIFFHIKEQIVPFIDQHWDVLCLARAKAGSWPNTITSTMSINNDTYRNGNSVVGGSGWWGLIAPDSPLILRLSHMRDHASTDPAHPHRAIGSHMEKPHVLLSPEALAKKLKKAAARMAQEPVASTVIHTPLSAAPLVSSALSPSTSLSGTSPASHVSLSKTQHASVEVSLTPHKPSVKRAKATAAQFGVDSFGGSHSLPSSSVPATIGVPAPTSPSTYIPPLSSTTMIMVKENSAEQIYIDKTGLFVRNGKGYCSARSSFPAVEGAWYYEATVSHADPQDCSHLMDKTNREWPTPPHWRLGWAHSKADTQAPPGSDQFSYSWRDHDGSIFHQGKKQQYSGGYGPGDVLGFLIDLPHRHDPHSSGTPELEHTGRIIFFKNGVPQGVAFENLWGCRSGDDLHGFLGYYPTVSAFYNGCISVNFGPVFKFPPAIADLSISRVSPCSDLPAAFHAYRKVHLMPPEPAPSAPTELPPSVNALAAPAASTVLPDSLSSEAKTEAIVTIETSEHSVPTATHPIAQPAPAPEPDADIMEGVVLLSAAPTHS